MNAKRSRHGGSILRIRPAFVVTGSLLVGAACAPPMAPKNDVPAETPRDLPLSDARGHLIFRKSGGGCYVQVPKPGDPPADFMSGEKWVEDEAVACPKELDDPAFAAVSDGSILGQAKDGSCYISQTYGNPPPPPVPVACPGFAKKARASEPSSK